MSWKVLEKSLNLFLTDLWESYNLLGCIKAGLQIHQACTVCGSTSGAPGLQCGFGTQTPTPPLSPFKILDTPVHWGLELGLEGWAGLLQRTGFRSLTWWPLYQRDLRRMESFAPAVACYDN